MPVSLSTVRSLQPVQESFSSSQRSIHFPILDCEHNFISILSNLIKINLTKGG